MLACFEFIHLLPPPWRGFFDLTIPISCTHHHHREAHTASRVDVWCDDLQPIWMYSRPIVNVCVCDVIGPLGADPERGPSHDCIPCLHHQLIWQGRPHPAPPPVLKGTHKKSRSGTSNSQRDKTETQKKRLTTSTRVSTHFVFFCSCAYFEATTPSFPD